MKLGSFVVEGTKDSYMGTCYWPSKGYKGTLTIRGCWYSWGHLDHPVSYFFWRLLKALWLSSWTVNTSFCPKIIWFLSSLHFFSFPFFSFFLNWDFYIRHWASFPMVSQAAHLEKKTLVICRTPFSQFHRPCLPNTITGFLVCKETCSTHAYVRSLGEKEQFSSICATASKPFEEPVICWQMMSEFLYC